MLKKYKSLSSAADDDVIPNMIVRDLKSEELVKSMEAVRVAGLLLSRDETLVRPLIAAGAVPPLVSALDRDDCPSHQYRALNVLTKLAFCSRDHGVTVVLHSGLISKLIHFIHSDSDLAELALLTLGNLALLGAAAAAARRSTIARVLAAGVLPRLRASTPLRLLRTFVLTYSNFLSHDDDETRLELGLPALPYLRDLLDIEHDDSIDPDDKQARLVACDIVVDACTALANITLGPDECTEAAQAVPGLTARLVALLGHGSDAVREPALSAVGNMLAGTNVQIYRCLSAGCLEHIILLLQSNTSPIVKEAARAAANIFAGKHLQIEKAIRKDILHPLRKILTYGDTECQKEAALAITTLLCNGTAVQRARVVSSDVLGSYCALLASPDLDLAGTVLEGLYELMQSVEREGDAKSLCYQLDEFDVLYHMEILQERIADEEQRIKIANIRVTLQKHAREERCLVQDDEVFTAERIVRDLESQEAEVQAQATAALFSMLREKNPPVNALMEAGLMSPIIGALNENACSDLVAVWALSYITAGTCTRRIASAANSGVIPKLLALLAHGDRVAELAACSLGSMALHGPETRRALLAYVESQTALMELKIYAQSYRRMCSEVCHVSMVNLVPALRALPFVSELLDVGDQNILVEACYALVNLMPSPHHQGIEAVQATPSLTARLVALVAHEAAVVKEAALNAVACMLTGSNAQIQRCVDVGFFDQIGPLLQSSEPSVAAAATRAATDILRHTPAIEIAMERNLLALLTNIISDGEPSCQKQAARALTNICRCGSREQRARVRSRPVLEPYCRLLAAPDHSLLRDLLDGLSILLEDAATNGQIKHLCIRLDKMDVLNRLLKLQEEEIDEVLRQKAVIVSFRLRQQVRKELIVLVDGKVHSLKDIVQGLKCGEVGRRREAAAAARDMLAGKKAPIETMVKAGVVKLLVDALDVDTCFDLQHAAAASLLRISQLGTYKHRAVVINAGGIKKLIALVYRGGPVATQAAAALGRVANRSPDTQELVHSLGIMPALLLHMHEGSTPDLLTSCLWAYSRICGKILSNAIFKGTLVALPSILKLMDMEYQEVLEPCCWAIAYLMSSLDQTMDSAQAVPGLTKRLVALLNHGSALVKRAALSALFNMLSGNAMSVRRCLDAGCLVPIVGFLHSDDPELLQLATGATSNVLNQLKDIDYPVLEQGILPPLINILTNAEPNSHIQYYALTAICHLVVNGTSEQKMAVIQEALPLLVTFLSYEDAVVERTVEILVRLTNDCVEATELALYCGVVPAILPHLHASRPRDILKNSLYAYHNFCAHERETPTEVSKQLLPALPYISDVLNCDDIVLLDSACAVVGNLIHVSEGLEAVCEVPGLTTRLVTLLGCETPSVKNNALGAVLHMLNGPVSQIDRCIDDGCLDYMKSLFQSTEARIVEMAVMATDQILNTSNIHIQQAIDKDLLQPMVNVLGSMEYSSNARIHAASGLFGIMSVGTQEQIMTLAGGGSEIIPKFIELMRHGDYLASVAAKCLGQLAQHPELRDSVLSHGATAAMMAHLNPATPLEELKNYVYAYKDFCRQDNYKQKEKVELVSPALSLLCELLNVEDHVIVGVICWSLANLTQTNEGIEAVQAVPGLTARLVDQLAHQDPAVQNKAMNTVLNMVSGTELQMEQCLDAGCLQHMANFLQSKDGELFKMALQATHNMFHICSSSCIQQILECGILALILDVLANPEFDTLQCCVVCAVGCMIVRGTDEQRMAIVDGGVIPNLVSLLGYEAMVANKAVQSIGNLALVTPGTRDLVLAHGAVEAMMPRMRDAPQLYVLAYRNICGYDADNPTEFLKRVSPALPYMAELMSTGDEVVLEAACYAAYRLLKTEEGIETVQGVAGLTARFVGLLQHEAAAVREVASNVVMTMLSGTDVQMDRCLEVGCVEHMTSYLRCRDPHLMKKAEEATRAELGSRSTPRHLQDHGITPLMAALSYCVMGRKITVRAIGNLYRRATATQRDQLVSNGVLGPYCAVLAGADHALIKDVLDSLNSLLQVAASEDDLKSFRSKLADVGILEQVEKLPEHEADEIKEKVVLFDTYLSRD